MGLIDIASNASTWRGYEYFRENRVLSWQQLGESEYEGKVSGSTEKPYTVRIDVNHPKKSVCNCQFAEGSRKVCKHKVALYFTIFPNEAEKYMAEVEKAEQEQAEYEKHIYELVEQRIMKMKKTELQYALLSVLSGAPEWVFDCFVKEYIEY